MAPQEARLLSLCDSERGARTSIRVLIDYGDYEV